METDLEGRWFIWLFMGFALLGYLEFICQSQRELKEMKR